MPEFKTVEELEEYILDTIADYIFQQSQENLIKNGSSDTGFLLRSGIVERNGKGSRKIKYDAEYADFVEYGTPPHMPPVKSLVGWAKRKLGLNEEEAQKVAWAIAIKIKQEGTEAQPYLRPALDKTDKLVIK